VVRDSSLSYDANHFVKMDAKGPAAVVYVVAVDDGMVRHWGWAGTLTAPGVECVERLAGFGTAAASSVEVLVSDASLEEAIPYRHRRHHRGPSCH
jgi:hypothetical protein